MRSRRRESGPAFDLNTAAAGGDVLDFDPDAPPVIVTRTPADEVAGASSPPRGARRLLFAYVLIGAALLAGMLADASARREVIRWASLDQAPAWASKHRASASGQTRDRLP